MIGFRVLRAALRVVDLCSVALSACQGNRQGDFKRGDATFSGRYGSYSIGTIWSYCLAPVTMGNWLDINVTK